MTSSMMKEVVISDEATPYPGKMAGVTLTISDLHKDYRSLTSEAGLQELTDNRHPYDLPDLQKYDIN
jgi:hypothetical protein